jgi:hypothetical protein
MYAFTGNRFGLVLAAAALLGCSSAGHSPGHSGTGGAGEEETGGTSGPATGGKGGPAPGVVKDAGAAGSTGGSVGTGGAGGSVTPPADAGATGGGGGVVDPTPMPLSAWKMHRDVKLNTSATGAGIMTTLENYPVPVQLTKDNFDFSQAKDDGSDLRFAKADGTLLPHEIELWDKANQVAAIWVKTQVMGNSATQSFVMYWGNPVVPGTGDSKAVFPQAENWVAVWHLGDDAAVMPDGFKDATGVNPGTGHNLEPGSAMPARMGRGTNLDHLKKQGVKVVENRKNFDMAKNMTFEIWGFVRSFGYDKGYESYMTKGDESWRYMRSGKTALTEICNDGNSATCVFSKSSVAFGKWYHFAGVHEGRVVRLYINGKREGQGTAGTDAGSFGDHAVTLGFSLHKMVEQRFMDMIIDEARVTKDSKSDDWVKLDYESVREGSTFVTFGDVVK